MGRSRGGRGSGGGTQLAQMYGCGQKKKTLPGKKRKRHPRHLVTSLSQVKKKKEKKERKKKKIKN
jgi:hypothetical protein